jgi:hypothetical protein
MAVVLLGEDKRGADSPLRLGRNQRQSRQPTRTVMKTKPTFLQTIAFALPLALWMPLSAPAQGSGELKPAPQTNESEQVFNFPGGTPRQFIEAVEKHFKVDWLSIASIRAEMEQVQVPKLRFTSRRGFLPVRQLVDIYNRLAERSPQLGTLVVEGPDDKPWVVMLVPNKTLESEQPKLKVKAFTIRGLSESLREKLRRDIGLAGFQAMEYASHMRGDSVARRSLEGSVEIHEDTKLLVAIGPESYVDMVESIVAAYHEQVAASNRPPPGK